MGRKVTKGSKEDVNVSSVESINLSADESGEEEENYVVERVVGRRVKSGTVGIAIYNLHLTPFVK